MSIERKLSDYIDRLNMEKKPEEHENPPDSPELEQLMGAVRQVKSLKEPALPGGDYARKLVENAAARPSRRHAARNARRGWMVGAAAVAAVLVALVVLNFNSMFGRGNIVYAMEKAFQGIKTYHGILEIVETNAEGKATTQGKLEIWAEKGGRYLVKELEGPQKGLITANDGQRKWQLRPDQKELHVFPAFPDPYRFVFELGKEVEGVKNALKTEIIGEETITGRNASVMEISPQGGVPYKLWIDKETKLPLQKQSGMQNALQYRAAYVEIDFMDEIPAELMAYSLPDGYKEVDTKPEQVVANGEEAEGLLDFTPRTPQTIPEGYSGDMIGVEPLDKVLKLYFTSKEEGKKVVILERKADGEFKPAPGAILGKVGNSTAEVQTPLKESQGILGGGGPYAGTTTVNSIRWQQDGLEYAVLGEVPPEELNKFIRSLGDGEVQIAAEEEKPSAKPRIEVAVDLKIEEAEQKSADGGHSPWKLDPAFVAQVFASLKISPEGILGEYPIGEEALKVVRNTGESAIVEISGDKTPVRRVYLKRLIRQDSTGIWTVVGYDPADEK